MNYSAEVIVTLKNGVRDPQGSAVDLILHRTGMEEKAEVSVGKYFTLSVSADNEDEAKTKLDRICDEVLSNPILESYRIERFERQ
ncbi:MAG: phosphoribosylformylglycinamidine synthase subunit PurS [Candidatus Gastranaerophilaceae bacterium]|jgi:phosphoribosylformylglycinamidine synthase